MLLIIPVVHHILQSQMPTENHGYNTPERGARQWHIALNDNFRELDKDVPLRTTERELSEKTPFDGTLAVCTDSRELFVGDDDNWVPLGEMINPEESTARMESRIDELEAQVRELSEQVADMTSK